MLPPNGFTMTAQAANDPINKCVSGVVVDDARLASRSNLQNSPSAQLADEQYTKPMKPRRAEYQDFPSRSKA